MLAEFRSVRTTLSLPEELVNRTQRFVDSGTVPSRNALVVAAVAQYVEQLEESEIDRQFEAIAEDVAYQELNVEIAAEFEESDWDALAEGENS